MVALLRCLSVWVLTVLSGVVAVSPAVSAPRRPAPVVPLKACIVSEPELRPIFPEPVPVADEEEDDDDDDEEEEPEEPEEFDEEAVRGWLSPDGVTCIAIGGSVNAGMQLDTRRAGKGRLTALRAIDAVTFPTTALLKYDAVSMMGDTPVTAGVTLAFRSGSDPQVDRAIVGFGPWRAGRDTSTFVFFDGGDFAFAARTPARQANIFAYTAQFTERLSFTLSAENPPDNASAALAGNPNLPGGRWPDVVGRLFYEDEGVSYHLSGAMRELRRSDGGPTRIATAVLAGASRDFEVSGVTHTLLAQAGGTLGAPVYIGSQLDNTDVLSVLSGNEVTNGWSGIASLSSAWTERLTTNAYASRFQLRVPTKGAGGQVDIGRIAANVVYRPVRMMKIGFEAGVSRSVTHLPTLGFHHAAIHRATAMVWMERTF